MYNIESKCKELPEYEYHDGVHTIFLSTKGKNRNEVSPEIIDFLEYVHADLPDSTGNFKSEYVRKLQDSVGKIKDDRDRRAEYMTTEVTLRKLYKDGQKAGREEGHTLGLEEGRSIGLEEGRSIGLEQGLSAGISETTDRYLGNQLRYNPSLRAAQILFNDLSEDYIRNFAREHNIRLDEP